MPSGEAPRICRRINTLIHPNALKGQSENPYARASLLTIRRVMAA
jgi:hypothetical protein